MALTGAIPPCRRLGSYSGGPAARGATPLWEVQRA